MDTFCSHKDFVTRKHQPMLHLRPFLVPRNAKAESLHQSSLRIVVAELLTVSAEICRMIIASLLVLNSHGKSLVPALECKGSSSSSLTAKRVTRRRPRLRVLKNSRRDQRGEIWPGFSRWQGITNCNCSGDEDFYGARQGRLRTSLQVVKKTRLVRAMTTRLGYWKAVRRRYMEGRKRRVRLRRIGMQARTTILDGRVDSLQPIALHNKCGEDHHYSGRSRRFLPTRRYPITSEDAKGEGVTVMRRSEGHAVFTTSPLIFPDQTPARIYFETRQAGCCPTIKNYNCIPVEDEDLLLEDHKHKYTTKNVFLQLMHMKQ
ncbi:unnamed protein product [Amoebophrya sp. A25]|nr:unnamed protein product [Amoebophrya sp. A25]|eukprot:GSA25T00019618001.1